jgi:dihydroorotase
METILISNATIINEGREINGSVLIEGEIIRSISDGVGANLLPQADITIDATNHYLMPGIIDDHVHFREPGLIHKGTIASESAAAVAGGVTSFMDMPNTAPQTTTIEQLEWKFRKASETSLANYSFFFGATGDNLSEFASLDKKRVPGIKLFLGSSTGNMLINHPGTLQRIFSESDHLLAVHAEKEDIIRQNIASYHRQYGSPLDIYFHPRLRNAEACFASTAEAINLAHKTGARLHVLHISTAKELSLFDEGVNVAAKRVTAEVAVGHLMFSEKDYPLLGSRIKVNPAIKTVKDRDELRIALRKHKIDIAATDHAPHLLHEKEGDCLTAASGMPMIQHSLVSMLELVGKGCLSRTQVVAKMCHRPADLYQIDRRGYIRPGYYADLVLVAPRTPWTVTKENILYKCGWSPFENHIFRNTIVKTFVNGTIAYDNGVINPCCRGKELSFLR